MVFRRKSPVALIGLCVFAWTQVLFAQWQWVNPSPTGNYLTATTWDGIRFVGFDTAGNVLTSVDGVQWSSHFSGEQDFVGSLVWGDGQYVAASDSFGVASIMTSPDAVTWTRQYVGVAVSRLQLLWNGDLNQFVAVGSSGVILTSPDGVSWTPRGSGTINDLNAIAWGNGSYVAVGANGTVLTSTNGRDWFEHTPAVGSIDLNRPLVSVAWNGTVFAVVSGDAPANVETTILTNVDPANDQPWKSVFATSDPSANSQLNRIVWDGTTFVAVGSTGFVVTSGGNDWTPARISSASDLVTLAFGRDRVLVTDYSSDFFTASLNAAQWKQQSSDFTRESVVSVLWTGEAFAAVGDSGSFFSSVDGVGWAANAAVLPTSPNAIAWGDGQFIAVADGGIFSSTDGGATWIERAHDQTGGVFLKGITWNNGQFVAVGNVNVGLPPFGLPRGVIMTSTDGQNWTTQASNALLGDSINAVTWGAGQFVAVGGSLVRGPDGDITLGPTPIFRSVDGASWARDEIPGFRGTSFKSIAFNGSRFVAVGTPGFLFDPRSVGTSLDAIQWEYISTLPPAPTPTTGELEGVTWTGSRFLTIGADSAELSSLDGQTWTAQATGAANGLVAIAASGSECVAVGPLGAIMIESTLCNADPIFKNGFE